jgi:hypothetical protein
VLPKIQARRDAITKSRDPGGWNRIALGHLSKLVLISVEELPREFVIRAEHQTTALGTEGHVVIETSQG